MTEAIDTSAKAAIIQCQARARVEERLEVTLTGVAPSAAGQSRSIRARAITPKGADPTVPDGVVVAEGKCDEIHILFVYGKWWYTLCFPTLRVLQDLFMNSRIPKES